MLIHRGSNMQSNTARAHTTKGALVVDTLVYLQGPLLTGRDITLALHPDQTFFPRPSVRPHFCLILSVERVVLGKIAALWDQYHADTLLWHSPKNLYQAKTHLQSGGWA